MAKVKRDLYVNRAMVRCTQSAANTLTFAKVNFAVGVFQGIALLIHKIAYHVSAGAIQGIVTNIDNFQVALTMSNQITDLTYARPEIIDSRELFGVLAGVAANLILVDNLIESDMSMLPGGGMLVPANPIYLGMDSNALATAHFVDVVIFFTFKELSDSDYIELMQSRIQANI